MGLIKDLIGGGLKGLGDTTKGIIQQVAENKMTIAEADILLDKEINRHTEFIIQKELETEKAMIEQVKNAQDMNMSIQNSDKASWVAKNVAYLIDIFVTLLWGGLTGYLMAVMLHLAPKTQGVDYTAVTAVWGAVTGIFGTVLNFHRGTSRGSEEKQRTLDKMIKKQ